MNVFLLSPGVRGMAGPSEKMDLGLSWEGLRSGSYKSTKEKKRE